MQTIVGQTPAIRDRRSITARRPARPSAAPKWRLLVKHPAGSLEAAVDSRAPPQPPRQHAASSACSARAWCCWSASTRRSQQLARQQMEFVATVSHELRTPLAVVRSAADNLADGVVQDEAQVRKYGELVRSEGRRLTEMVEQILEFAGIQSGQRTLTPRADPRRRADRRRAARLGTLIDAAQHRGRGRHPGRPAAGQRRRGGAAPRLPEPARQRDQVRRRRRLDRHRGAPRRRPRCSVTRQRSRHRHRPRRSGPHLRAVLPRRRRRRRADPGRRPRPQPGPAHRRGARRPDHREEREGRGQRVHRAPAGGQRAGRRSSPPRVGADAPAQASRYS